MPSLWLKAVLLALSVLCAWAPPQTDGAQPSPSTAPAEPDIRTDFSGLSKHRVSRVVDGDTVVLAIDGVDTTVRLIGVDAPEKSDARKAAEPFAAESSEFLTNLLAGEEVFVEDNEGPQKTDRYGRHLCYLYRSPDGLFVNIEIIRQGYGHALTEYPFQHLERFRATEAQARDAKRGLWAPEEPTGPMAVKPAAAPSPRQPSDEAQKPPKRDEAASITVYVTRTGAKYHTSGCRYLAKSKIAMKLKDAKGRYSPCSVCKPPM